MFIKKDLRKIPTILDEAVACEVYDASIAGDNDDENDNSRGNIQKDPKAKRTKREEPLRVLKLGRRKQEFEGSVRVLCQPSHAPKLKYLEVLNLYDCDIHDLEGFGSIFSKAAPNLETLNLGRNPLSKGIPDDFAKVKSLKHLWLDDCKLKGAFPKALLQLTNIESLRLPNNQITDLDIGGVDANAAKENSDGEEFEFEFTGDNDKNTTKVIPLLNLKILCLDRNRLGGSHKGKEATTEKSSTESGEAKSARGMETDPPTTLGDAPMGENSNDDSSVRFLPSNFAEWAPNLEECFLRHNNLTELRVQNWPKSLKILQISSNQLKGLDDLVGDGRSLSLTHVYANGNHLESIPKNILSCHPTLERLVISHNPPLTHMPEEVWQRLQDTKDSNDDNTIEISWQPNPNLRAPGDNADTVENKATNMHVC